ncbi:MAG: hypothetical protein GY724_21915 [Actinomycetia bacterium]|nr:hypothetical protein [Actinomycetes bacterium]
MGLDLKQRLVGFLGIVLALILGVQFVLPGLLGEEPVEAPPVVTVGDQSSVGTVRLDPTVVSGDLLTRFPERPLRTSPFTATDSEVLLQENGADTGG